MKYEERTTVRHVLNGMIKHRLLVQHGTKRLEYNLLDGEYLVFNGDDLVWQGSLERTAVKHYNKQRTREVIKERNIS